jgi:hypothetical protein
VPEPAAAVLLALALPVFAFGFSVDAEVRRCTAYSGANEHTRLPLLDLAPSRDDLRLLLPDRWMKQ